MKRFLSLLFLPLAGLATPAEPAKTPAGDPVELVVGEGTLARLQLRVEIDGKPLSALRDEALAALFAYSDRNADGFLDAKEAARLPSASALRQAAGNGFVPPVGSAPTFASLDTDGDGKLSPAEVASYYKASGFGQARIGVGRLPASGELTAALLEQLDTDGDGRVSEAEFKAAAESLKKLDANDDELIGAGELVPKRVWPGAAGTLLLTAPARSDTEAPADVVAQLPLKLLPADAIPAALKGEPPTLKTIALGKADAGSRWSMAVGNIRLEGWTTAGKIDEAVSSARRQLVEQFEQPSPEPMPKTGTNRRRTGSLEWLTPVADRDDDGTLERKELDAWLDLQTAIGKTQVILTVLDRGGLFELLDTDRDGALSVRELRRAWDRVKEAGCAGDGRFDPKKLPRVVLLAASAGYPKTLVVGTRRGPAWFQAMDRNGDGDVSRREFTGPADRFDKLDADNDGLIDADEAAKATPK